MSESRRKLIRDLKELDGKATGEPWVSAWETDLTSLHSDEVVIQGANNEEVFGLYWYDGVHPGCKEEDTKLICYLRNNLKKIIRELQHDTANNPNSGTPGFG